ncbi:mitogen-activated protein kinase [Syncephalis fuscata]|nr:mitogen-activated protein kinase [Syncephalis fuscata]KAI9592070.1 mitogen-activated protein kinase [Syncephalis fuscata]
MATNVSDSSMVEESQAQQQQRDELESYLHQLLACHPRDLLVCLVTDREGVILGQAMTDQTRENLHEPPMSSTFTVASEQASKLGLGRHRTVACMTGLHQLVQASRPPLVISLIADAQANTGLLLELANQVRDTVKDLALVVAEGGVVE